MSYIEKFVLPEEYSINFDFLKQLQPVTQDTIKLFGKTHKVPRFQQTYGFDYKFSSITAVALPIPEEFSQLVNFFNEKYKCNFNGMLINWYCYYIGMHSDDEKQIKTLNPKNSPIVTISFGESRKFVTEEKVSKNKETFIMNDKDVIVMCGEFQKTHKHGIPKQLKVKNLRISVTLRCFQ